MDQILNKVGSYWFSQKANKEISSVGDDFNSMSTSIEGGAKWLVNKIKGKMQKPLPELLKEYDLPVGLFPRDATNYEFNEETRKLIVYVPAVCEVGFKDSSVLRFSTTITGYLEKGKLADIEGVKTKVMIWVKVTSISSDGSKLHFSAGMKKTRSREVYEVLRDVLRPYCMPPSGYSKDKDSLFSETRLIRVGKGNEGGSISFKLVKGDGLFNLRQVEAVTNMI
uniref:DUF538 domain-containing protein n=1 Tax=Fagus sylvatica TaxID=28930 RepID=A0A2N9G074_FAGSY